MICPHCRGEVPVHRSVTGPDRCRLHGHHGEIEMDSRQLAALVANAVEYGKKRRKLVQALNALGLYREVAERMEHDPAFADHVLSYDGDGGRRFFPGATKAARLAQFKNRVRSGDVREGDLLHYIEIMMDQ